MSTKCTYFCKSWKFFCCVIEGLQEKRQAVKLLKSNIFFKQQAQNNTIETIDITVLRNSCESNITSSDIFTTLECISHISLELTVYVYPYKS